MELSDPAGLCAACRWSRRVPNRRGSVFLLCRRAEHDHRFVRYPRIPLVECAGFEASARDSLGRSEGRMSASEFLVLTVIGEDSPGLVETLAETIATHEGNWLESRMSHLAGKFAGILRLSVPRGRTQELQRALDALAAKGLEIVARSTSEVPERYRTARLELVGSDHPGIVRDISTALARRSVNVEELQTGCSDAPMSGQTLFRATARLELPAEVGLDELRRDLEAVAQDLMVDIVLAPEA